MLIMWVQIKKIHAVHLETVKKKDFILWIIDNFYMLSVLYKVSNKIKENQLDQVLDDWSWILK